MQQPWFCGACKKDGRIHMTGREGVWEGAQAILQAHRKVSPGCNGSNVRVKAVGRKQAPAKAPKANP